MPKTRARPPPLPARTDGPRRRSCGQQSPFADRRVTGSDRIRCRPTPCRRPSAIDRAHRRPGSSRGNNRITRQVDPRHLPVEAVRYPHRPLALRQRPSGRRRRVYRSTGPLPKSIRESVRASALDTQSAPAPTARPDGSPTSSILRRRLPLVALMFGNSLSAAACHPHGAVAEGDLVRSAAERIKLHDAVGRGVDPRHGPVKAVRNPYRSGSDRDSARAAPWPASFAGPHDRPRVDARDRVIIELRHPKRAQPRCQFSWQPQLGSETLASTSPPCRSRLSRGRSPRCA